jgi:hypothetical protein
MTVVHKGRCSRLALVLHNIRTKIGACQQSPVKKSKQTKRQFKKIIKTIFRKDCGFGH